MLSINLAEKKIREHLRLGGGLDDQVGSELLAKFCTTALSDRQVAAIAQKYNMSMEDIAFIYMAMILKLMPNPCIISGGLLLVPTLFFMEPKRFERLAFGIDFHTKDLDEKQRIQELMRLSAESAQEVWDAHTSGRGEADFTVTKSGGLQSSGGCMSVLIIGAVILVCSGIFITTFV